MTGLHDGGFLLRPFSMDISACTPRDGPDHQDKAQSKRENSPKGGFSQMDLQLKRSVNLPFPIE